MPPSTRLTGPTTPGRFGLRPGRGFFTFYRRPADSGGRIMFLFNALRDLRRGTARRRSGPRQHAARRGSTRPLLLELLEGRTLLSIFTVLNNADGGPDSLRTMIASAISGDTIQFDPSLAGQTITLTSGELVI